MTVNNNNNNNMCECGHTTQEHYPQFYWMNGCKDTNCSCLGWRTKK